MTLDKKIANEAQETRGKKKGRSANTRRDWRTAKRGAKASVLRLIRADET